MSSKPKVQKVKLPPIHAIFRFLQTKTRVSIWIYEHFNMKIEGQIIGFDEYMNLVLNDAEEIFSKTGARKQIGTIMLKGECITLIESVNPEPEQD